MILHGVKISFYASFLCGILDVLTSMSAPRVSHIDKQEEAEKSQAHRELSYCSIGQMHCIQLKCWTEIQLLVCAHSRRSSWIRRKSHNHP
jgi:hypothetical protein